MNSLAKSLLKQSKRRYYYNSIIKFRGYKYTAQQYDEMFEQSINPKTREDFWSKEANKLSWFKEYDNVMVKESERKYHYFTGGATNISYNCIDRHILNGKGNNVAIIYDSPVTNQKKKYTYNDLLENVSKVANILKAQNIKKGDKVIIYMPMIPQAAFAMLACARIGAIHSVVFGGFSSKELATRIDDCKPKAIIAANCGVEPNRLVDYTNLVSEGLKISKHQPKTLLMKSRKGTSISNNSLEEIPSNVNNVENFLDFDTEMQKASSICEPVHLKGEDTAYILYTSGTTGTPKGIVRAVGGLQVSLSFSMDKIMQVDQDEVFFTASDIGWVVGHSYIIYGPLLNGNTSILYEGKPIVPDAGVFWRVIEEHKVDAMFTAPTALRAIKKMDPNCEFLDKYDTSTLRSLFLAGERSDPETVQFYSEKLKNVDLVDNFWQTESGFPILAMHNTSIGIKPGSASKPVPGFDCQILDAESSKPVKNNTLGDLCIKLPLPPGCLTTVLNDEDRFYSAYLKDHEGYYSTGDSAIRDDDGYFSIMSRKDDIINVAAHRLSSGALEEVLVSHPDVAEACCCAAKDDLKGQIPVGFIVLNSGVTKSFDEVEKEVIQKVRQDIGPVASFKLCFAVNNLPKTRSGKILRNLLKQSLDGEVDIKVPGTIEDLDVLHDVQSVIKKRYLV